MLVRCIWILGGERGKWGKWGFRVWVWGWSWIEWDGGGGVE